MAFGEARATGDAGDISRFAPSRPLPPYTYVPGRTPHPKSDPRGHAHGLESEPPAPFIPENLVASPDFRYGADLFHAGYYWEAHEVWEGLWHAVGRRGPVADLLKGLIKLAAAGVKVLEGSAHGAMSHARRAAELLELARGGGIATVGLTPLGELARAARSIAAAPPHDFGPAEVPHSVWSIRLRLDA